MQPIFAKVRITIGWRKSHKIIELVLNPKGCNIHSTMPIFAFKLKSETAYLIIGFLLKDSVLMSIAF